MKKYINIENLNNVIVRVLSITDSPISPNGLQYIEIDNFVEPPTEINHEKDIAYPMYNKDTKEFYWVVVNYQTTTTEVNLQLENTNYQLSIAQSQIDNLTAKLDGANETIALLVETQADVLGGAI